MFLNLFQSAYRDRILNGCTSQSRQNVPAIFVQLNDQRVWLGTAPLFDRITGCIKVGIGFTFLQLKLNWVVKIILTGSTFHNNNERYNLNCDYWDCLFLTDALDASRLKLAALFWPWMYVPPGKFPQLILQFLNSIEKLIFFLILRFVEFYFSSL